jgi:hypothetical protein
MVATPSPWLETVKHVCLEIEHPMTSLNDPQQLEHRHRWDAKGRGRALLCASTGRAPTGRLMHQIELCARQLEGPDCFLTEPQFRSLKHDMIYFVLVAGK